MAVARFALDDAVWMALSGQLTNAPCVAGVLAAARVRDAGWAPLRPVDAAEPQSPSTGLE
jgi:ADP-ribose pyrophosphatase